MKYTTITMNLSPEGKPGVFMVGSVDELYNYQSRELEKLLSEGYEISGTTPIVQTTKNQRTGDLFTYTSSVLFHLIKR